MPMRNPFRSESESETPEAVTPEVKPPEKSQAELLAETATDLKNAFNGAITALTSKVDALEHRFQKPTPVNNEAPTFTSVFEDEDRAIGERVARVVGPLYQSQLETQAKIAFNEVRDEYVAKGYGEVLNQFGQTITERLSAAPLLDNAGQAYRGNKEFIRRTINEVFGAAAIEAGMRFGGKDKGFFIESAGNGAETSGGFKQGDGLTEGQRKVFARMEVTPEEAKKTIGKLQFV